MLTREEIITRLRESAAALATELAPYDDDAWTRRPAEGGWNAQETVEHLILVESGVLAMLRAALAAPPTERTAPISDEAVWERLTGMARRVEAPERVRPAGQWTDRAAALAEFARRRAVTIQYAETTTDPLRERWIRITVGEIDGMQTLLMLSGHLLRHLAQIRAANPPSAQ